MNTAKSRIRVAVLCGGKSAEHEISLLSAKNVITTLDPNKYDPFPIGIDKNGTWRLLATQDLLNIAADPAKAAIGDGFPRVALDIGASSFFLPEQQGRKLDVDVIFPILHGPCGEDGTVQGLLKLMNIPFCGAGLMGSAVGMDKDVMKRLLRDAGVPGAAFLCYRNAEHAQRSLEKIEKELGYPCFVKPANMGSSVGISRAQNRTELAKAIDLAFLYDRKIVVEQGIVGREIECSILGSDTLQVSLPGEVIPRHAFYSYEAKYLDADGAALEYPARLNKDEVTTVQQAALKAYQVLECEGFARVDLFLTKEGKAYINEINTLPGFTNISMYPKLWEVSGQPVREVLSRIVDLAIERHERENALRTSYF